MHGVLPLQFTLSVPKGAAEGEGGQTTLKANSQNLSLESCISQVLAEELRVRVDGETDHKGGTRGPRLVALWDKLMTKCNWSYPTGYKLRIGNCF